MQGTIRNIPYRGNPGLIFGDDGSQYTFTVLAWRDAATSASPGMKVDFEIRGTHAVGIYPVTGVTQPQSTPMPPVGTIRSPLPTPAARRAISPQPPSHLATFPNAAPANASSRAANLNYPASPGSPKPTPPSGVVARQPSPNYVRPATAPPSAGPQRPAASPTPSRVETGSVAIQRPAQRSGSQVKLAWVLVAAVVGALAIGAFWYFQMQPSDEEIADSVAREWTSTSINDVSELVIGMVVGNAPIVAKVGGDLLTDKIRDAVSWSYSPADCPREGWCVVTTTATARFNVYVPFLLDDTVTVKVPFSLKIDTGERHVENWAMDVRSASVQGISLGAGAGAVSDAVLSSGDDVMRAVGRVKQLADANGVQEVFDDASDAWDTLVDDDVWEDFTNDEDVQRVFEDVSDAWEDVSDTWEEIVEDEDVQRIFDDASDAWSDFDDDDFHDAFDDASDALDSLGSLWGD